MRACEVSSARTDWSSSSTISASLCGHWGRALLVSEALKEIRVRARQDGFEQREHYVVERSNTFNWQELEATANNLSLFSNRRVIELRLPTPRPGDLGSRTLRALVERSDPGSY